MNKLAFSIGSLQAFTLVDQKSFTQNHVDKWDHVQLFLAMHLAIAASMQTLY